MRCLAVGADMCNSARGFMMALGCVQSLICDTNRCPTGIATRDPKLEKGLVVTDKVERVKLFPYVEIGGLLEPPCPERFRQPVAESDPSSSLPVDYVARHEEGIKKTLDVAASA